MRSGRSGDEKIKGLSTAQNLFCATRFASNRMDHDDEGCNRSTTGEPWFPAQSTATIIYWPRKSVQLYFHVATSYFSVNVQRRSERQEEIEELWNPLIKTWFTEGR